MSATHTTTTVAQRRTIASLAREHGLPESCVWVAGRFDQRRVRVVFANGQARIVNSNGTWVDA